MIQRLSTIVTSDRNPGPRPEISPGGSISTIEEDEFLVQQLSTYPTHNPPKPHRPHKPHKPGPHKPHPITGHIIEGDEDLDDGNFIGIFEFGGSEDEDSILDLDEELDTFLEESTEPDEWIITDPVVVRPEELEEGIELIIPIVEIDDQYDPFDPFDPSIQPDGGKIQLFMHNNELRNAYIQGDQIILESSGVIKEIGNGIYNFELRDVISPQLMFNEENSSVDLELEHNLSLEMVEQVEDWCVEPSIISANLNCYTTSCSKNIDADILDEIIAKTGSTCDFKAVKDYCEMVTTKARFPVELVSD